MTPAEQLTRAAWSKGAEDGAFFVVAEFLRLYETYGLAYALKWVQRLYASEEAVREFVGDRRREL